MLKNIPRTGEQSSRGDMSHRGGVMPGKRRRSASSDKEVADARRKLSTENGVAESTKAERDKDREPTPDSGGH